MKSIHFEFYLHSASMQFQYKLFGLDNEMMPMCVRMRYLPFFVIKSSKTISFWSLKCMCIVWINYGLQ